ncbi:hypothetical protein [Allomesorhizobium alhagi]|uniref:Uncharacterized protein n=1 Tax=Mesorhizobium alhagi CCNWXJ12-2 TaxID=1107882 RepID=H0HNK4_9HYPH|nr:hypothetical protein [Mesorhizobium alhagi]EHK57657.1 hypothetical protein MAXJ12_08634 [Mesorhizobium alhagi CCNWXJ12-2]
MTQQPDDSRPVRTVADIIAELVDWKARQEIEGHKPYGRLPGGRWTR